MSVPEELVQAAAEALVAADATTDPALGLPLRAARIALAAAFAALPECEELPGARTHEGRMIYAALAREFGEGT